MDETGYYRDPLTGGVRITNKPEFPGDATLIGFESGSPVHRSAFDYVVPDSQIRDQLRRVESGELQSFRSAEGQHFSSANAALRKALNDNPGLADHLGINPSWTGNAPAGFTWHHHQDFGRLQLVRTAPHSSANHTGGIALWPLYARQIGLVD